jgi:Fur family transcriptional regulator, ferric uptake regulator
LQYSCNYYKLSSMEEHIEQCDALEILKTSKCNKTPQRLAVLEELIKSSAPLCVNDILTNIGDILKINKVTVYRVLTVFKHVGIIREIETGQGIHFYEMACHHNPVHPHFKCRLCGALTCMSPLTLSQTWDWFAQAKSYSIEHININITGLCKQCHRE